MPIYFFYRYYDTVALHLLLVIHLKALTIKLKQTLILILFRPNSNRYRTEARHYRNK